MKNLIMLQLKNIKLNILTFFDKIKNGKKRRNKGVKDEKGNLILQGSQKLYTKANNGIDDKKMFEKLLYALAIFLYIILLFSLICIIITLSINVIIPLISIFVFFVNKVNLISNIQTLITLFYVPYVFLVGLYFVALYKVLVKLIKFSYKKFKQIVGEKIK